MSNDLNKINSKSTLKHVAIIMDGNGRWAKDQGKTRLFGHNQGVKALKKAIDFAITAKIQHLTPWLFSLANWKRPQTEVSGLMNIMRSVLKKDLQELHEKGIRLKFLGHRAGIANDILDLMDYSQEKTQNNDTLFLNIAFNYDGKSDILQAVQNLFRDYSNNNKTNIQIDDGTFSQYLMTKDIPEPDLVIRTSGIVRLSNFMMWQCAFSELVFLDKNWPDFNEYDFQYCIDKFYQCQRNFGAIKAH